MKLRIINLILSITALILAVAMLIIKNEEKIDGIHIRTINNKETIITINKDNTCKITGFNSECFVEKNKDNYKILLNTYNLYDENLIGIFASEKECNDKNEMYKEELLITTKCSKQTEEYTLIKVNDGLLLNDILYKKIK